MCSIMGISSKSVPLAKVKDQFDKTISRGPDMSRVIETKSGYLCFHRLAIMDLHPAGMQPFEMDGDYVVCNGEIYNFRITKEKLKEKYSFISESDCELLLPLYREHGVGFFELLDAEFALVLYDSKTDSLLAARDPIGIRPLFYGYIADGSIAFASEAKNLIGLCDKVFPFPPGHYLFAIATLQRLKNIAPTTSMPLVWKSAHA